MVTALEKLKKKPASPEYKKVDKMTSSIEQYYRDTKDFVKKEADKVRNDPAFKEKVLRDADENFRNNNVKSRREKEDLIKIIAAEEMSMRLDRKDIIDRVQKIHDDVIEQNEVAENMLRNKKLSTKEYNELVDRTYKPWSDSGDGFQDEVKVDTSGWLPKENKSEKKPSFLTNARINYYKSEIDYLSGPRYKGESDTEYEFRMKQIDEFQRALDKINGK